MGIDLPAPAAPEPLPSPLLAKVSVGKDIRRPAALEPRTTESVLFGIRDGEWRRPVLRVRDLPFDSSEQRKAKARLPYFIPAGLFERRHSSSLIAHSGLVAMDLDGLCDAELYRIRHLALDDSHCFACFQSARGQGLRLLLRVPANPQQHSAAYRAALEHVRSHYRTEPDDSGSDLARACFLSYDGGLWLNPGAEVLPVSLEARVTLHSELSHYAKRSLAPPSWVWSAREHQPHRLKPDGTVFTHRALLNLSKALALRSTRDGYWMAEGQIDAVAKVWFSEAQRRGFKLRGSLADYQNELNGMVAGARKCEWFNDAATKWTRWKSDPEFPERPRDRLAFAIRKHCASTGKQEFYLSCRDAATVTGTSNPYASQLLRELVRDGILSRIEKKRSALKAITYSLNDELSPK